MWKRRRSKIEKGFSNFRSPQCGKRECKKERAESWEGRIDSAETQNLKDLGCGKMFNTSISLYGMV